MEVSRLGFLKGLASAFGAGALGGGARLFAAPPGWQPPGNANLVFGVVSDTHLRTTADGKYSKKYWSDKWFVSALRCFRSQNVDAVLHLGDMAHTGQIAEMEFHAAAWRKVFPKDLAPDGHKVERLFVAGNHDLDGTTYGIGELVKKLYPDPEEFKKHVLCTDIAGSWQRIWGEPYAEAWHRVVKGYHFFGRHYAGKDFKACEAKTLALVKEVDAKCGLAKDKKPFFHFSHIRAHATFNKAMAPYRNAVGFFGHWHASASNWSVIHMFGSSPTIQCPSCAPMGSNSLSPGTCKWAKAPFAEVTQDDLGRSRQGYIVRVYDDMVVFERHEFGKGGKIGADWIMPLGKYDPHPFVQSELLKAIGKPQFRKGAKLEICNCGNVESCKQPLSNGQDANSKSSDETASQPMGNSAIPQSLKISIPPADGNPKCRVFAYEVAVCASPLSPTQPPPTQTLTTQTPKPFSKLVFATGCNVSAAHAPKGGVTAVEFKREELPPGGELAFRVTPRSCLGTSGAPLCENKKLDSIVIQQ